MLLDHFHWGMSLLTRWISGEENTPSADADRGAVAHLSRCGCGGSYLPDFATGIVADE